MSHTRSGCSEDGPPGLLTDRLDKVNIVFVEPSFPRNQRRFVQALRSVGANVIGVGETPEDWLDPDVRDALVGYYKVDNVTHSARGHSDRRRPRH